MSSAGGTVAGVGEGQAAPEFSLKDQLDTWKVIVPVKDRPTKQMNKLNLKNVFSVTLRDTGEVALIDGDTKEIVNVVKTTTPDRAQELVLARAKSIVNQVFTVSVNCAGPVGMGRIVPGMEKPNDGMVTVAETRWPGARDHAVLPVTHMQMLWSRACLIQTLHFLDTGRFLRGGVRA